MKLEPQTNHEVSEGSRRELATAGLSEDRQARHEHGDDTYARHVLLGDQQCGGGWRVRRKRRLPD